MLTQSVVVQTVAEDPTGIVSAWWPIVGMLLPFVIGLATRYNVGGYVKFIVALLFSLAAAATTAYGFDWSAFSYGELGTRFAAIFGIAQVTYQTVDRLLVSVRGVELNQILLPNKGIV